MKLAIAASDVTGFDAPAGDIVIVGPSARGQ